MYDVRRILLIYSIGAIPRGESASTRVSPITSKTSLSNGSGPKSLIFFRIRSTTGLVSDSRWSFFRYRSFSKNFFNRPNSNGSIFASLPKVPVIGSVLFAAKLNRSRISCTAPEKRFELFMSSDEASGPSIPSKYAFSFFSIDTISLDIFRLLRSSPFSPGPGACLGSCMVER